jgi:murein DD-endopeptidase MepM/ murein hydrolase activator NlpD
MKQEYFVVVLAHSLKGRLRRIHVPHQAVYAIVALALLGCFSVFGFVASYARMAWKVANYNALRSEIETLRSRYQSLQKEASTTNEQLATLQLYAKEVSVAYGLKQKFEGPSDISGEGRLVPSFAETLQDYDFLLNSSRLALRTHGSRQLQSFSATPGIWPVDGRIIRSPFGVRTDPFSGEGAVHTGIDISVPAGTPVRAAAAGVVESAQFYGGYGRLVVIRHGGGVVTYYAHLQRFYVHSGQEVQQGDMVGAVGSSGRATAPHLHYEVRVGGTPINPYRYLAKAATFHQAKGKEFPF